MTNEELQAILKPINDIKDILIAILTQLRPKYFITEGGVTSCPNILDGVDKIFEDSKKRIKESVRDL